MGDDASDGGRCRQDCETPSTSAGGDQGLDEGVVDTGAEDGGVRLDVGDGGQGNGCDGLGGGGGDVEFTYIWIANSEEGTVSKIDTRLATEVARYETGPEPVSQPSRTSVNLAGDVAVANRGGGYMGAPVSGGSITKIAAVEARCVDKNGNGTIETSSGAGDALPWGEDECVLWNTPVESTTYTSGPRPLAWEGRGSDGGCSNPRLWMGFHDFEGNRGIFRRLNGADGSVVDEVIVDQWSLLPDMDRHVMGPYGAAVDANGDVWVSGFKDGPLLHIDGDSLATTKVELDMTPEDTRFSYGMALDSDGRPWVADGTSAARYNPDAGTWDFALTTNTRFRGLTVDREGRAWLAVDQRAEAPKCGLAIVATDSMTVMEDFIELPGCIRPVGVSIDVDGFAWVVDVEAEVAFKVDPDTFQVVTTVTGLVQPYTYSDMTGAGLSLVVNPG